MYASNRGHAGALVLLLCVITLSLPVVLNSQDASPAISGECGSAVTPEEAVRYLELLSQPVPDTAPSAPTPPYCVPIAGHIVRTSAGTGGLSLTQYNQAITDANLHYANTGIVFYSLGIDYIDSDFFYSNISTINDINALRSTNVVNAAINCYFTPVLPGLCGISSFTFSSVQGIVMNNGCTGTPSNPSTFSHEIGHYFDLFHTHETAFGTEFVDGTNCNSAGDRFCDTPADPNLGGLVNPSCVYFGTGTDPHGDQYNPDVSQIMSYARAICADTFSPQSVTKAVNTLLNLRPNLLSRGCSAVAPATVSAATPPQGFLDQTVDVVLVGTNFRSFTTVQMGIDVNVITVDTLSTSDSLQVSVSIAANATPGLRDIIVFNAFDPDTLTDGFGVMATPRHYVSPAGGNLYPYAQPSDAAISFEDAVAAAGAGDSVIVDTTTVTNVSLNIATPVTLSGGWTNNFTSRDLIAKKTTLDLNGNILISGATGVVTIDGFVLENGRGAPDVAPIIGDYGGALRIFDATVTISNCELRNNDASPGLGFGGGGAIFATNADITVDNCHIHNNDATRGGGIYLYQSTATISNSTIELNAIATGGSTSPTGGGLALENCSTVTLTNTVVSGNTGASNGGGIWVIDTAALNVIGGQVLGHVTSSGGGGVTINHTTAAFNGVSFLSNSAAVLGGAIVGEDTSTVTVVECEFKDNTALLGAGMMMNPGELHVRHNIFSNNSASITGGALYVIGATAGEIVGNTIDLGTGLSGAGGILLANSPIPVFNNIVTNSTGDGISCSGTSPTFSYNLVWNSSGADYTGCSAGPGSVSADPLYDNAPARDYHLAINSPAIDAGEPSAPNNDPDGSRGDIGRYGSHAFTMDQPEYPRNVAANAALGQLTLSWDPNTEDDIDYYAVYCDTINGFVPSAVTLVSSSPDTSLTVPEPTDTTYYVVSAIDTSGYAGGYSPQVVSEGGTATAVGDIVRHTYRLDQNVPNPFNPSTTIRFALAKSGRVDVVIYDVAGRRVRTLINDTRPANVYTVQWNGINDRGQRVASGIYFYRLTAGLFTQTKKMVLLK